MLKFRSNKAKVMHY